MWDKRAAVLGNHDGDTITVVLDQGFGDTKEISLRLDGVWAPELSEVGGPETRDFVTEWWSTRVLGAKWPFVVTTRRNRADTTELRTFTRYVGTLTHGQDSLNADINAFVHANGYSGGTGS